MTIDHEGPVFTVTKEACELPLDVGYRGKLLLKYSREGSDSEAWLERFEHFSNNSQSPIPIVVEDIWVKLGPVDDNSRTRTLTVPWFEPEHPEDLTRDTEGPLDGFERSRVILVSDDLSRLVGLPDALTTYYLTSEEKDNNQSHCFLSVGLGAELLAPRFDRRGDRVSTMLCFDTEALALIGPFVVDLSLQADSEAMQREGTTFVPMTRHSWPSSHQSSRETHSSPIDPSTAAQVSVGFGDGRLLSATRTEDHAAWQVSLRRGEESPGV